MFHRQRSAEISPGLGEDETERFGEEESAIEIANQSEDGNDDLR